MIRLCEYLCNICDCLKRDNTSKKDTECNHSIESDEIKIVESNKSVDSNKSVENKSENKPLREKQHLIGVSRISLTTRVSKRVDENKTEPHKSEGEEEDVFISKELEEFEELDGDLWDK